MIPLQNNPNVDNSDLANYPDGRIKDNTGTGNGTPVNRATKGDWHSSISRMMRLYGIVGNGLPDNETNGYQIIEAIIALASKNDFVLPLSLASGVLNVPIKLEFMLENESVICKSGFNLGAETQIKGSGTTIFAFTKFGSFKANEYVRLIKTSSAIELIRIGDSVSIDSMVSDFNYLKKATQAEENAGTIDTKATTPLSNLTAFIRRVIGGDSTNYLATTSRNGLLSMADKAIINGIGASPVKNYGTVSFDPGGSSGSLTHSGDVVSATGVMIGTTIVATITIANAMTGLNYLVEAYVQGQSSAIENDGGCSVPVFKPTSSTTFQLTMRDYQGGAQNLKVHLRVVQL